MWIDGKKKKAWSPPLESLHLLRDSPRALSCMNDQDKSKNDLRTLEKTVLIIFQIPYFSETPIKCQLSEAEKIDPIIKISTVGLP